MTLSTPVVIAIAFFGPIAVLMVIGRIKAYLRRAAPVTAEELSLSSLSEPKAELSPNILMRRFNLPQRTYLRAQYALALTCSALSAYVLFVSASLGLLPEHIRMYASANPYQRIWESYVDMLSATGHLSLAFAFLGGLMVVSYLKAPTSAVFIRTRPISQKFLFWGRASFALASILAGALTAIAASVLLLFLVYGPVWKLASAPPASIFRMGLSILTTTALVFSLFIFVTCLFRGTPLRGGSRFLPVLLGITIGSQLLRVSRLAFSTHAPGFLFLFPVQALPQALPVPLTFALVPIVSAAALLWIAQRLSTQFEI